MSEANDELRRQTIIRMLKLFPTGTRRCPGCGQETVLYFKRSTPSGDTKPRCLDCWKAER